jgi:capsular exopolysaccharide synthesis family protein
VQYAPTDHNAHLPIADKKPDPADSIDLHKLWHVTRKCLPWIAGIFIVAITLAWLIIRYTKDLYESSSVLQLDVQSDASVLGFRSFDDEINDLSREIELIKSKLFFSKVVEQIDLDVGYFQYGDILYEERYQSAPFEVEYTIVNPDFYNRSIDLVILNDRQYRISYGQGSEVVQHTQDFGQPLTTPNFTLIINQRYISNYDYRYFFIIYNTAAQIDYLERSISVAPLDFKAKTIEISFRDYNRQKAKDVLTAIDTLYIYYTQLEKNKATQQKINFLNQQLQQTEQRLSELENYFESFTIRNRTMNLDKNLTKTISALEALDSQQLVLRNKQEAIARMRAQMAAEEELVLEPAAMRSLPDYIQQDLERLETLEEEMRLLLSSYNKNTLAYKRKQQELDHLRKGLVENLQQYHTQVREQLANLATQRTTLESEFVQLPGKRTEYSKTERYYELQEEFYLTLMKNKAEFELAQAGLVTNYKILSSATTPANPISPDKFLIVGISLVVSTLLSLLLIALSYLMHNKITSIQDVERATKLPIVGVIPFFKMEKKENKRLMVDKHPKSSISEAFRSIRSNLEFISRTGEKNIIAITSSTSGEGKTFIAVNLGGIISMLDNKVVLIDMDMRKPRLQKVFYTADTSKGLSTILIGKHTAEDCILPTNLPNLDYIPSGPIPPNPSELALSPTFYTLLEHLRLIYDVIIVDTPPVGLVTDGLPALRKANIPLYVMRADFSKKPFVRQVEKMEKTYHIKNLSLVLNGVKGKRNGYGYYYGEGQGYYEESMAPKKGSLFAKLTSFLG